MNIYRVFNDYNLSMKLTPRDPPGHARRKLRGLVPEIERLRNEGHTIDAIHQALLDVGIQVSWAAVQRETARLKKAPSTILKSNVQLDTSAVSSHTDTTIPPAPVATVEVDSFFVQHNTNPLFRKKGKQ